MYVKYTDIGPRYVRIKKSDYNWIKKIILIALYAFADCILTRDNYTMLSTKWIVEYN